jgi:hypothetical protein
MLGLTMGQAVSPYTINWPANTTPLASSNPDLEHSQGRDVSVSRVDAKTEHLAPKNRQPRGRWSSSVLFINLSKVISVSSLGETSFKYPRPLKK